MENYGITVTVNGLTPKNATKLGEVLAAVTTEFNNGTIHGVAKPSKPATLAKPAPATKGKKVVEETFPDETDETAWADDASEVEETEEVETEEEIVDDDTEEQRAGVTAALKKFAARGPEYAAKAKAALKKYKCTHVDDLKPEYFAPILKLLK